jgi:hypothetical protein
MLHGAGDNTSLAYLAYHQGELDSRVSSLERDMATIKHWGLRAVIIISLWLMALLGNLKADTAADLIVAVLKKL